MARTGSYTRRINLYINGQRVRNDIKSINARMIHLRRTIRTLQVGSREYVRQMRQIRHLDGIIRAHNQQLKITHINLISLKGLANAFNKYWPMVMGTIGALAGVAMGARRSAQMFAEFEDQISDVMKVTGLTRHEVVELNQELIKMDTRTAQESLMELAWVAGKLGIDAVDDILGFVNAADKITVALAKDLGGSAEEAVRQIGKMTEIFELRDEWGIEESMLRTASAINELGMASTAQESTLINFAYRVGGIAPVAGVSIQNILGLGAALDILGQKIEVSATAYSRVMTTLARDTEVMARLAGMSMRAFSDLFREDANEAMMRVFESIGRTEGGFEALIASLGEAGLEGQRLTQVLGALIRNTEIIREQQKLANQAFEEGDSVLKEYNIKNYNAQAILEKKQKELANLRRELGERLMPVYMGALSLQERYLKSLVSIVEWLYKNHRSVVTLVLIITSYKISLAALALTQRTYIISTKSLIALVQVLKISFFYLTGQVNLLNKAMLKLKMLGLKNPWLAAIAAAAAIGVAIYRITKKTEESILTIADTIQRADEEFSKHATTVRRLHGIVEDNNLATKYRIEALKELNKIVPEYNGYLTDEGVLIRQNTEALDDYLNKLKEKIRSQVLEEDIVDTMRQIMETERELAAAMERLEQAKERLDKAWEESPGDRGKYLAAWDQFRPIQQEVDELTESLNNLNKSLDNLISYRPAQAKTPLVEQWEKELKEIEQALKSLKEQEYEIKIKPTTPDRGFKDTFQEGVYVLGEFIWRHDEESIRELKERGNEVRAWLKALRGAIEQDPIKIEIEDFSEKAEALEKYRLKEQFLQGKLLGGWEEYQQKRDEIELRFMAGRFKAADEDSQERLKLRGQILNKEIELLRAQQSKIDKLQETAVMHDAIKVEEIAYEKRLREHELFHQGKLKQVEDMTKEEHAAYLALEEEYQQNLREIYADLIQEEIERRVNAHELKMMQMQADHIRELRAAADLEKTKEILARYVDQKELQRITTHEQAKRRLKEIHAYEEREANRKHLERLMADLLEILDSDQLESIIKADKVLSDEEKRAILESIAEVQKAIDDLKGDDDDGDGKPSVKRFRGLHFDIFGFFMDDWVNLFNHMEEVLGRKVETMGDLFEFLGEEIRQALDPDEGFGRGIEGFQMLALAATNVWQDIGRIISNIREEKLRDLEETHDQEMDQLRERYELGLISEEYYQDQRSKMEGEMEQQRARHARRQARRDRNIALFQAVINTAAAVIKALPNFVLAGIVAAAGALQIGVIKSTPLPRIPGAEGGGFLDVLRSQDGRRFRAKHQPDKRGWVSKPTVVTGEDGLEYVLPREAIENPTIKPFVDMIEMARVSGNLPALDMGAVAPAIMPGRSKGGALESFYTMGKIAGLEHEPDETSQTTNELLEKNIKLLEALNRRLTSPITANVSLTGRGGFFEADEKYEQLKKNVYL